MLSYWFYPNPGNTYYSSPKVVLLLVVCVGLIIAAYLLRRWRSSSENPVTKKLTRTWASAAFWFGITGLVLVVSRVEGIQFFAMRFLWFLWGLALFAFAVFQWQMFRKRHYQVLPRVTVEDEREKYLPGKKKH